MNTKLFLIALIASVQIFAQQTKKADSTRFAEITFEEPNHDFGTLNKGDNCVFYYKFTNTGNEPLIISIARTGCGCDVADWPKEPIMPGKSGVIKYRYDSQRIGVFHKSTTVTSNARNGTVVLKVRGVVVETIPAPEIKLQIDGD